MLARSSQATATELCLLQASCRIVASFEWCSVQPGEADTKAFWMVLSMQPLLSMQSCHLFSRMVVNSFPTREVRALGQKYKGSDGSPLAEVFASNLMVAFFHVDGTEELD